MEKSALITGAGGGIGRGLALALARRGYRLFLVGRDAARLQAVAAELEGCPRPELYPTDLADPAARSRLIDSLLAGAGAPELLIHNAARMPAGEFLHLPASELEEALAVNLLAPAELTRRLCAVSPAPQGVIFMLSTAARFPQPYNSLYSASKAGLRFLAEGLQVELAGRTRVCLAYPPLSDTPMTTSFKSPIPKADPLRVAESIVRAYERGRDEISWVDWEVLPVTFYRLLPGLFRRLLKGQRRRLAEVYLI
jgi:short-subunit dehydrogenase